MRKSDKLKRNEAEGAEKARDERKSREIKTKLHSTRLSVQEKCRAAEEIRGGCYLSVCVLSGVWAQGEIMKQ